MQVVQPRRMTLLHDSNEAGRLQLLCLLQLLHFALCELMSLLSAPTTHMLLSLQEPLRCHIQPLV